MKLAYVTTFDARSLDTSSNWAGTGYYIPESLKQQSISVQYIGPLNERVVLQGICKVKRHYHNLFSKKTYLKTLDPLILKSYAQQVSQELSRLETDVVLSATITPIAYLRYHKPIVFWADATFQNLLNFYPQFTGLCEETIQNGHLMERLVLQRCKLAIYSSEWAAKTAIEYYEAEPSKVKVVSFGANIKTNQSFEEIKNLIDSRPEHRCKLLFLGVDWFRKGGDLALEVARQLNDAGLETELTIVGGEPITDEPLPKFVKSLGFIRKSDEGQKKISQLLADSHFLILPSLADCTPIVFCEANSLGVPCISRRVGGIPTVIKDGYNGKLFAKESDATEYCKYIIELFSDFTQYKDLALSAFYEYEARLNWRVAGQKVKDLLTLII